MIDLHTHSVFSDGSMTPEELVAVAAEAQLTVVALTDHDTTEGLPRFFAATKTSGVRGITGVEISAEHHPGALHMLGYFFDPAHAGLQEKLAQLRAGRTERNQKILNHLHELGLELTWDEVHALAGGEVVGRPHFARAMIARGHVKDKDEAFAKFLARGKPAYAERFRLSPADSIQMIREAGGVPVLAHPCSLKLGQKMLRALLLELRDAGLEGVEVYHSEHNSSQAKLFHRLAVDLGLAVTGGSDFHGALMPDIKLGRGFGSLRVPDDLLPVLEARRPA
ncbi:MAG: PHP domain-containing protein [Verrucomicrobia bacterium]|nr:MAG: PHP domain-containing protein [Verrucomicrobiota bacterium]